MNRVLIPLSRRVFVRAALLKKVSILALSIFVCSCAGPSMMGFPHSSMRPAGGTELAVVGHTGGGGSNESGFGDAGGLLSVAHDFGGVGMSFAAGAYYTTNTVNWNAHLECGIHLDDPRNDLLVGVGYSQNLDLGMSSDDEQQVPQLSFGFLRGAPLHTHGFFGGFRTSLGPIIQHDGASSPRYANGAQIYFSGALGYQWWTARVLGVSVQLAPFFGIYAKYEPGFAYGGLLMLSFSFGNRSTPPKKSKAEMEYP